MKKVSREDGFTLVEVLVGMLMMMLVLFALYSMFDMTLRIFQAGNDNTKSLANARVAMDRMEREIRSAWNSSSTCSSGTSTGALLDVSPAEGSTLDRITFYNCLSGSDTPTKVSYRVNSGNLERAQGSTTTPDTVGTYERLAPLGSGGSLSLKYFTSTNTAVVSPLSSGTTGSVALVQVKIVAESGDSTQTLTNNIALRNWS